MNQRCKIVAMMCIIHKVLLQGATLLGLLLHCNTYVTLCCRTFLELPPIRHATLWTSSCVSTHTSRYAAGCCLALPPVRHATPLDLLLPFHTYEALGTQNYSFVVVKCLRRLCHGILTTNLLKKNKNAQIGQFHHHPVIVWCHHRHGLFQALTPFFWHLRCAHLVWST